jgi:hypothetical protein
MNYMVIAFGYQLAISKTVGASGNSSYIGGFDVKTKYPLITNDPKLAIYYENRIDSVYTYDGDYIAKIMFRIQSGLQGDLPQKYISVKTPNTQFIILALDNIRLLSTTGINKNILIVSKLDKNVTIDLPFRYYDYNTTNKSISSNSNSLIKVISNNIIIDASDINSMNLATGEIRYGDNIDITGIFSAFYNPNSTINIINADNDVNINVFGAFQSYDGIKINGQDIFNTQAKEFYYSDPRVDKLNDIASLKIYRTQILAKEIIKFPSR